MKQVLSNHLKNILGWKTKRKIVIISVDDYGNVRLDSKKARNIMDAKGLKIENRFDAYDSLESTEDLEALYEVLSSVKDKNGNHAVFTPFALPCNINFEAMKEEGYKRYISETLPETYAKLSAIHGRAYFKTWDVWQEGISKGLLAPQYHGREHLNVAELNDKLNAKNEEVKISLETRSYTSISQSTYPTRKWTASFSYWEPSELIELVKIAIDGFDIFSQVFGKNPVHFMAPRATVHQEIIKELVKKGIKACDYAMFANVHEGKGKFKRTFNYTGQKNVGSIKLIRNVVFEPTTNREKSISLAMSQINAAFAMNRPANISSHRVNFSGFIDESNRKQGLSSLKELLTQIVKKHPDVEFMSSSKLIDIMLNEK